MGTPDSDSQLVARTIDSIVKLKEDNCTYRCLELTNSVRVLLDSVPDEEEVYVTASVRVGSLCDPPDCQGLANLCGLAIVQTLKKYTDDDDTTALMRISDQAAFHVDTMTDNTCYCFSTNSDGLHESLNKLAAGLHRPLFPEASVESSLHILDANFRIDSSQDDTHRLEQLQRSLSNLAHPFGRFFPGRSETLQLPPSAGGVGGGPASVRALRQRLVEFHDGNYSTNRICLAVMGSGSLDQLQAAVLATFGRLPKKLLPPPSWIGHPFDGTETGVKVWLKVSSCYFAFTNSVEGAHIKIVFPLPDQRQHYQASPDLYVSRLVGYTGRGGLVDCLKRCGISCYVGAVLDADVAGPGFDSFSVHVFLDNASEQNENKAIAAVFRYLALLRKVGPQEWLYNEDRDLRRLAFRFDECKEPPVHSLALAMQRYPLRDVITARHLLTEFSPNKVTEFLGHLRAVRCKVFIETVEVGQKCNCTEQHYGTPYGVEKLGPKLLSACTDVFSESATWAELDAQLRLPEPNRFVCSEFELRPREPPLPGQSQLESPGPRQLRLGRPDVRLWFRQDTEFLSPRAFCSVELVVPATFADCESAVLTDLYVRLMEAWLSDLALEAGLASMHVDIRRSVGGILLYFEGCNQRLSSLVDAALRHVVRPEGLDDDMLQSIFEEALATMKENRNSLSQLGPHFTCEHYYNVICHNMSWPPEDSARALAGATLTKVEQFARTHLLLQSGQSQPQPQPQLFAEILVYGNVTAEDAVSIGRTVVAALWPSSAPATAGSAATVTVQRPRERLLPNGSHHVVRLAGDSEDASCCLVYYQTEAPNSAASFGEKLRYHVHFQLLSLALHMVCLELEPHQAQGNEPLYVDDDPGLHANGVVLWIESERHPVEEEKRIDAFVDGLAARLDAMPAEMLDSITEEHLLTLKQKARAWSMREAHNNYWKEITGDSCGVGWSADMANYLETTGVTTADLVAFWRTWLDKTSPSRCKLSVHYISALNCGSIDDAVYANYSGTVIEDPVAFKLGLAQSPPPSVESLGEVCDPPVER